MKSFFLAEESAVTSIVTSQQPPVEPQASASPDIIEQSPGSQHRFLARVAIYDSALAAPRVEDVTAAHASALIDSLSKTVYELAHELGSVAPYTVLREVVENLIHANFSEIVVSILDQGRTIRFADQGPGILDKDQALRPGFSTATIYMKDHIRGVGSGLPIVNEFLAHGGGSLVIEDNLGRGTVVTLSFEPAGNPQPVVDQGAEAASPAPEIDLPPLSLRQKKVLSLVMEIGEVGPTLVSKELAVGLSTAYRDLASLEDLGLIEADESGKRVLTGSGSAFLGRLFD